MTVQGKADIGRQHQKACFEALLEGVPTNAQYISRSHVEVQMAAKGNHNAITVTNWSQNVLFVGEQQLSQYESASMEEGQQLTFGRPGPGGRAVRFLSFKLEVRSVDEQEVPAEDDARTSASALEGSQDGQSQGGQSQSCGSVASKAALVQSERSEGSGRELPRKRLLTERMDRQMPPLPRERSWVTAPC